MNRKCPCCLLEKDIISFNTQGKYCLECHREKNKTWRMNNQLKFAESKQKFDNKYKVSDDSYILCVDCQTKKIATKFNWKIKLKGIRNFRCKQCDKVYRTNNYHKYRDRIIARTTRRNLDHRIDSTRKILDFLLHHPCKKCGESNPLKLTFHHIDAKTKSFNIGECKRRYMKWSKIQEEIDKCEVLCANCHHELTAMENNYISWQLLKNESNEN